MQTDLQQTNFYLYNKVHLELGPQKNTIARKCKTGIYFRG